MKTRWRVDVYIYSILSDDKGPVLMWSETFYFKWMAKLSYFAWIMMPYGTGISVTWPELKEVKVE